MKQTIIMILCILIILIGGISEIKYLEKSSTYLNYDLEYVKNAIENDNYDIAKQQMESIITTWNKDKIIWNMFIINEEVDEIEHSLAELNEYINYENKEECMVELALLKSQITYSVEMQKVSLETII